MQLTRQLCILGFQLLVPVVSVASASTTVEENSMRQKRQIQLVVRDRMHSISCNRYNTKWAWHDSILLMETIACNSYDKCNKNVSQNTPLLFSKWRRRSNVTLNARSPLSWRNFCAMNHFTTNSQTITRTNKLEIPGRNFCLSSCFNSCTRVLYSPSCSLARTQNLCFLRFGLSLRLRRTALRRN